MTRYYKFWWKDGTTSVLAGVDEMDALDSVRKSENDHEYFEEVEAPQALTSASGEGV